MIDYALQLETINQSLKTADVYLRGVDSFLQKADMRAQALEDIRVRKQAEHDSAIENIVNNMHTKAGQFFTQWEQLGAVDN